ncbi:MAG TPA: pitrilysin family protein, partial [Candidatus Omnitrophota bacterium]|nr:pitrilysin family protein [Candidatus Omnitrophota bacterium]
MAFKGSRKYSSREIKERVEGVGGMLNAFTSEEQTCFFAKVPSKFLKEAFDVLSDISFFPQWRQKDFIKEKSVIMEEIKMYHDQPQYLVMELLHKLLWPNNSLGAPLAGTVDSVAGLTLEDLKSFHHNYYHSGNAVLVVCGDVCHREVKKIVKKKLASLKKQEVLFFDKVNEAFSSPRIHCYKKDIEQTHLAIGFPSYAYRDERKYALELLSIILGENMSSRLFAQVREKKGLAYAIQSKEKTFEDTGFFVIRAGVDNKKVVEATDVILKELIKIKEKSISSDELIRAREYKIGHLLLEIEDTLEHMLWLGEHLIFRNKIESVKNLVEKFKKIGKKDIGYVAQDIFKHNKLTLAIIGPVEEKDEKKLNDFASPRGWGKG